MSKVAKLIFVGTGGGGGMVATQKLATAGTYFETDDTKLFIDPGPGALLRSRQLGIKTEQLDALLITHRHIDHMHDTNALIEAWRNLDNPADSPGKKWVYGPGDLFEKYPIAYYLNNKYDKKVIVTAQTKYQINSLTITSSKGLIEKPNHSSDLPEVYGYWIQGGTIDVGFWSQSQYKPGITDGFRPKTLVMDFWSLNPEAFEHQKNILKEMKPEKIILRHFIVPMFEYGVQNVAQMVEKETGIQTIAAPEGGTLEI